MTTTSNTTTTTLLRCKRCGKDETIRPIHPILELCHACQCKKNRVNNPDYNDRWYELAKKTRINLLSNPIEMGKVDKAKKEAEEIAAMQGWSFTNLTHEIKSDRIYLYAIPTDEERHYYRCGAIKKTGIHVLVLEHKIGRKLDKVKKEHVHHIDDNSLNNWPDNIELKAEPIHNSETHKKKQLDSRVCDGPGPHRHSTNIQPLSGVRISWYKVNGGFWCQGCYDRRRRKINKQKRQRVKNKELKI